jgi:hypothetical protein
MTWSDFPFQVNIIVNPDNVVWFSIRPTTHLDLACRALPLWMESLHPNLTSDWRNSDNLDNNHHPIGPTRLGSLIAYAYFTCLACYFFLFVFSCLSTLDRVGKTMSENLMESRRQEQETQESDENTIVSEWRQVLTPTYPYLSTIHLPSTTTTLC